MLLYIASLVELKNFVSKWIRLLSIYNFVITYSSECVRKWNLTLILMFLLSYMLEATISCIPCGITYPKISFCIGLMILILSSAMSWVFTVYISDLQRDWADLLHSYGFLLFHFWFNFSMLLRLSCNHRCCILFCSLVFNSSFFKRK